MKKPENPNAFPIALKDNGNPNHPDAKGMSLRDYFAAKAMQAIIGNYKDKPPFAGYDREDFYEKVSSMSYFMAGAMLKKRSKDSSPD